jgi:hypothetical protein
MTKAGIVFLERHHRSIPLRFACSVTGFVFLKESEVKSHKEQPENQNREPNLLNRRNC